MSVRVTAIGFPAVNEGLYLVLITPRKQTGIRTRRGRTLMKGNGAG